MKNVMCKCVPPSTGEEDVFFSHDLFIKKMEYLKIKTYKQKLPDLIQSFMTSNILFQN